MTIRAWVCFNCGTIYDSFLDECMAGCGPVTKVLICPEADAKTVECDWCSPYTTAHQSGEEPYQQLLQIPAPEEAT